MLPENTSCYDVVLTDTVLSQLHQHKANSSGTAGQPIQPFFIGMGVHKVMLGLSSASLCVSNMPG